MNLRKNLLMTMLHNGDAEYSELCLHLRICCVARDNHFIYSAVFVARLKLCSSCVRVCGHAACLGVRHFCNSSLRCHLNPCFLFCGFVWFSLLDSDQDNKLPGTLQIIKNLLRATVLCTVFS